MSYIFHNFLYIPLYNILMALAAILPGNDLGLAIIILTILVRILIYPLSKKAVTTQLKMKALEPRMNEIKSTIKDKQEQGRKLLDLYKEEGVNPFSGILTIFIQIPVILALFWVFQAGMLIDQTLLYDFVTPPAKLGIKLLGLLDITAKNIVLAFLVGVTQYLVAKGAMAGQKPVAPKEGEQPTFGQDFAKSMQFQMTYMLPIFIAFVSYGIGAAISIYWITNNLFHLGQERAIKKSLDSNLQ